MNELSLTSLSNPITRGYPLGVSIQGGEGGLNFPHGEAVVYPSCVINEQINSGGWKLTNFVGSFCDGKRLAVIVSTPLLPGADPILSNILTTALHEGDIDADVPLIRRSNIVSILQDEPIEDDILTEEERHIYIKLANLGHTTASQIWQFFRCLSLVDDEHSGVLLVPEIQLILYALSNGDARPVYFSPHFRHELTLDRFHSYFDSYFGCNSILGGDHGVDNVSEGSGDILLDPQNSTYQAAVLLFPLVGPSSANILASFGQVDVCRLPFRRILLDLILAPNEPHSYWVTDTSVLSQNYNNLVERTIMATILPPRGDDDDDNAAVREDEEVVLDPRPIPSIYETTTDDQLAPIQDEVDILPESSLLANLGLQNLSHDVVALANLCLLDFHFWFDPTIRVTRNFSRFVELHPERIDILSENPALPMEVLRYPLWHFLLSHNPINLHDDYSNRSLRDYAMRLYAILSNPRACALLVGNTRFLNELKNIRAIWCQTFTLPNDDSNTIIERSLLSSIHKAINMNV